MLAGWAPLTRDVTWLWLANDAETRLIVGCTSGPRDKETAENLWYSLPTEYRERGLLHRLFESLCQRSAFKTL